VVTDTGENGGGIFCTCGGTEMDKILTLMLASLLALVGMNAVACEYIQGETKYADWANCKYGPDSVLVVDLPDNIGWEQCVYHDQGFGMYKLLAVTRMVEGKEKLSTFNRAQLGNPCYLTKQSCERAREAQQ
jgi:hypothetical protein